VIESFDNHVDPRSGTVRVRALFDNRDGTLTPGLYARIKLGAQAPRRAVLVSDLAIGTDQHKRFVYVVGEGNRLEWREVRPGARVDGLRIIEQGLSAGERVVVSGLQRVRPGQQVAPQAAAPQSAAASAPQHEARS
jgi:multidrug efflux system membrane fusion protein